MQLEHEFVVPVPIAEAWDVLLDVERIAPCMPGATVESFDGENVEGRVKVKVGPIQVTYAGTARFIDKDEVNRKVTIDAKGKEARGSGTAAATIHTQLIDDGGTSTKVTVTTDLAITGKPAQFGRGVMVEVGNKLLGRFADCLHEEIAGTGHGPAEIASDTAVTGEADANVSDGSGAPGGAAPVESPAVSAGGNGGQASGSGGSGSDASASGGSASPGEAAPGTAAPGATASGATGSDESASGAAAPSAAAAKIAEATGGPHPVARPAPAPRPATRRRAENEAIDLLDAAGPAVLKRLVPLVAAVVALVLLWRFARRR